MLFQLAATAQQADTLRVLDEVSITAIKALGPSARGALAPVAVTSVGEDEIERLDIVTMKSVSEIAPNFYIPDYGSRMTSSIYVRGIGARIDQPVVGLNVDNVAFLNKDNYDFDLVDIERIEVMRGPQSTLYGRNTMGGVVNITTLSPLKFRGFRAKAEAATGNSYSGSVSGYFGVSDRVAMGVVLQANYLGGYFRNEYNGASADREEGGSLRWKTSWRPSARVTLENSAGINISRQHGYPYALTGTGRIAYNDTCFYRRTGITDGLTVTWIAPKFTLSSISSFQYIDDNMTLDQDFLPLSYFTLTQKRREWALTQDIVVKGKTGRYSWMGGLFGFVRHTDMHAPVNFKEQGIGELIEGHRNEYNPFYPVEWRGDVFLLDSEFEMPAAGFAIYHRSSVDIGDFTIAADLRLDHERVALRYASDCSAIYDVLDLTGTVPSVFQTVNLEIHDRDRLDKSFTQMLPKLSVTWRVPSLPRSIVYASVAKGYKVGGYNTQMFSDVLQQKVMETMGISAKYDIDRIVSYDPEHSWNYEIGAHLANAPNTIKGEVAAFYIDCRNQQLTMFPDGTTTGRIMTNAGKTRSFGVELSGHCQIVKTLALRVAYGYTNARFVEFDNGRENYAGKRVPYAPSNTLFASLTWRRSLTRTLELELNGSLRGVGSIYWDEENLYRQPFYAQLGASATLRGARWSVDIWGENLTDTRFDTFSYVSIGNRFLQRGKPVRGGVTLRLTLPRL